MGRRYSDREGSPDDQGTQPGKIDYAAQQEEDDRLYASSVSLSRCSLLTAIIDIQIVRETNIRLCLSARYIKISSIPY